MADEKPTVATPNQAYREMKQAWELPDALMGGTRAMRAAGRRFLPQEKREHNAEWEARLRRTTLFNGFRRTVKILGSKPLATPPTHSDNLPTKLEPVWTDPDLTGRGLANFCRGLMDDLLARGKAHILVEFPQVNKMLSKLEEKAAGVRPYFVRLAPQQVIAWRGAMVNGVEQLEQLRYRITTMEPDGDWGEKAVDRIVVWFRDLVQWYRLVEVERGEKEWRLEVEAANTLGYIPLVTIYANQTGFLQAEPPLEDLAELNLEHWQSKSDQKNILHVARVPLLHFKGFAKDDVQGSAVGPFNAFFGGKDSDIKYVEIQGAAVEAGEKDLEKLEDQMRVMGADLLVERPGNETATARAIDSAEKVSDLSAITTQTEDGLADAYQVAGDWMRTPVPEDFSVSLNHRFGLSQRDQVIRDFLLKARSIGDISRQTFLEHARRFGFLIDDLDIDEEIQMIEDEAPGRGGLADLDEEGTPEEDEEEARAT